jgi:CBS domain-containing protein
MGNVKELMTERPTTCQTSASVVDAAKLMARQDVGPIPVVESDRLVGLVTDRDIAVRVVAEGRDPTSTTVGEIASKDLATVAPDDDLEQALTLMAKRQVRRLPVVDGDRVVGIVAQADVARHLEEARTGEVVEQISKK